MSDPEFKTYPLAKHLRVSRDGRVESCMKLGRDGGVPGDTWRPVVVNTTSPQCRGYPFVTIKKATGKYGQAAVHKLVALTWLGPPPEPGMYVRHLDDNKQNFHVTNLAWGTRSQNIRDAKANGKYRRGSDHRNAKLTDSQRQLVNLNGVLGAPLGPLAKKFGVTYAALHYVAFGRKRNGNWVPRRGRLSNGSWPQELAKVLRSHKLEPAERLTDAEMLKGMFRRLEEPQTDQCNKA